MKDLQYEQKKQALIEEITTAFDGVSREGGVSLSEAWVIDDYGSDEERAKARKQDTETSWQEVSDKDIAHGYSCLCFLDEIGFRYYIPAYIVWYLRYIDVNDSADPNYDSNTFEWLLYGLGSVRSGKLNDFYFSHFKALTLEQSRAIAHFLVFDEERSDAFAIIREKHRQEEMLKEGFTQKQIDAAWQLAEINRIHAGLADNDARRALVKYWGQFL